jgi:hypothetical protein
MDYTDKIDSLIAQISEVGRDVAVIGNELKHIDDMVKTIKGIQEERLNALENEQLRINAIIHVYKWIFGAVISVMGAVGATFLRHLHVISK